MTTPFVSSMPMIASSYAGNILDERGSDATGAATAGGLAIEGVGAAHTNPASLAGLGNKKEIGFECGYQNYADFSGIVYDKNGDGQVTDAQGYPEYGTVYVGNGTSCAVRGGFTYQAGPFTLGAVAGLPLSGLTIQLYPNVPVYDVLKPGFDLGVGTELVRGIKVGGAVRPEGVLEIEGQGYLETSSSAFDPETGESVSATVVAGMDSATIHLKPVPRFRLSGEINSDLLNKDPEGVPLWSVYGSWELPRRVTARYSLTGLSDKEIAIGGEMVTDLGLVLDTEGEVSLILPGRLSAGIVGRPEWGNHQLTLGAHYLLIQKEGSSPMGFVPGFQGTFEDKDLGKVAVRVNTPIPEDLYQDEWQFSVGAADAIALDRGPFESLTLAAGYRYNSSSISSKRKWDDIVAVDPAKHLVTGGVGLNWTNQDQRQVSLMANGLWEQLVATTYHQAPPNGYYYRGDVLGGDLPVGGYNLSGGLTLTVSGAPGESQTLIQASQSAVQSVQDLFKKDDDPAK